MRPGPELRRELGIYPQVPQRKSAVRIKRLAVHEVVLYQSYYNRLGNRLSENKQRNGKNWLRIVI